MSNIKTYIPSQMAAIQGPVLATAEIGTVDGVTMAKQRDVCPNCGHPYDRSRIQRQAVGDRAVRLEWNTCSQCRHVGLAEFRWEDEDTGAPVAAREPSVRDRMRAAFGEVVASCQQYEASLHEHGLVHPRTRELLRAYRSAVQAHREAVVAVAQTLV